MGMEEAPPPPCRVPQGCRWQGAQSHQLAVPPHARHLGLDCVPLLCSQVTWRPGKLCSVTMVTCRNSCSSISS